MEPFTYPNKTPDKAQQRIKFTISFRTCQAQTPLISMALKPKGSLDYSCSIDLGKLT